MQTVAVIGVGLIGGSFGLALRCVGFGGPILGVSSPAAVNAGLAAGAISEESTLERAINEADLIYLAQPVDRILQTLEQIGPLVRPDCLVTDAGSTKAAIVAAGTQYLPPGTFLGGHPMAGKEQRGAEAADGGLFRGRPYVLTPVGEMSARMQSFQELLSRMDARIVIMSPSEHDQVVALTSHLPQLLSTALSVTLAAQDNPRLFEVFGPGLLEMTRLALSSPDIWTSVLYTNREPIVNALGELAGTVDAIRKDLEAGRSINDLFSSGQRLAALLRNG
jgi:prephenate dehydrogenase